MKKVNVYGVLNRVLSSENATIGKLSIMDDFGNMVFDCDTLELLYRSNQRRVSSIPIGVYNVVLHNSPKFGKCYLIQNVINRSNILIHTGNYSKDTKGCVLVGFGLLYTSIGKEVILCKSQSAMEIFLSKNIQQFTLTIK